MADNFFQQEQEVPQQEQAPEKIKVGEQEFTQDELNRVVGLGKIADEAQTKYNRDISKFWPEFTKSQQKSQEMEKELQELKSFKERLTSPEVKVPSQEELKAQAIQQARELGLTDTETTRQIIREEMQAARLLSQIETMREDFKEAGKPDVTPDNLLKYMVDNDYKSPLRAYSDMYEKELKEWETKQVNTIKQPGYTTQETSTAGSKEPTLEKPKNEEQLKASLNSFFNSSEGAERT